MNTKIKYIRLTDGCELVSEVDVDAWKNNEFTRLHDPMKLYVIPPFMNPEPGAGDDQTLIMTKWLPWSTGPININLRDITVMTDVDMHMVDHYESTRDQEVVGSESRTVDELDDLRDMFNDLTKKKILN